MATIIYRRNSLLVELAGTGIHLVILVGCWRVLKKQRVIQTTLSPEAEAAAVSLLKEVTKSSAVSAPQLTLVLKLYQLGITLHHVIVCWQIYDKPPRTLSEIVPAELQTVCAKNPTDYKEFNYAVTYEVVQLMKIDVLKVRDKIKKFMEKMKLNRETLQLQPTT